MAGGQVRGGLDFTMTGLQFATHGTGSLCEVERLHSPSPQGLQAPAPWACWPPFCSPQACGHPSPLLMGLRLPSPSSSPQSEVLGNIALPYTLPALYITERRPPWTDPCSGAALHHSSVGLLEKEERPHLLMHPGLRG
ncbi:hypothetical protein KIL84_002734 [Mauremys mutica]|uniref:Uncharacterized protein n=1 Tax=Mauremys mutica TaxID=74926 RepID=A0A9D4AST4_9SAUR|nr:hypothetical protein KIL84_002734 [Mauremys mutica]